MHLDDRIRAKLSMPRILGWPCEQRDSRNCYRFEIPQRMHGLWTTYFEVSDFTDSSAVPATYAEALENKILLEVDMSILPPDCCSETHYEIEFLGRRTSHAGDYGSRSQHLVVVDKVISIRPVNSQEWIAHRIGGSSARAR